MDEACLSPAEAARLLGIPEEEAGKLAQPDGHVPLEKVRDRAGAATLELARELARALSLIHI